MDPHSQSPLATSHSGDVLLAERASLNPVDPIFGRWQSQTASRFLARLQAKEIVGCAGSYLIKPGTYKNCLLKLFDEDRELWLDVTHNLRYEVILDREIDIMGTTVFHEALTISIHDLIWSKISALKATSKGPTKSFLEKIVSHGGAHIELSEGTFRSPDDQYKITGQKRPGVVVEISYSQSLQELTRKAVSYLTSSMGQIQMVIGLNVTYRSSSANLTLHVWSAKESTMPPSIGWEKTVDKQICSETSITQGILIIPLKAFGTSDVIISQHLNTDLNMEIVIGFDELATCFQNAKRDHDDSGNRS